MKNVLFEMWGDCLKNQRAQRLGVYQGFMNINMSYKTYHKEKQKKQKMSQSPSEK